MKFTKAFLSIAFTLALIWVLQKKFGPAPPFGDFLSPADGFWQNAESKNILPTTHLMLPGLTGKVTIKYDENRIPHIFADNEHDLYYAQGYITATERLWQMDIQTRQAAGRLAEVLGPQLLEVDRYHRRMGMVYGAEKTLKAMMNEPAVRQMVLAYTDGINAYIHRLHPRQYPIEFKLLDYAPEDWKPINCAFLLKLMSETLAGGSNEFAMSNILKKFGPQTTGDLFPDYPFHEDPIIPSGTKWDFKPLTIPKPSASFLAQMNDSAKRMVKAEGIGSNNWAVAGNKTANGYPILANDPHLNLTFPSIWYQIQLTAPSVNVYGVSLPGSPCVILGFNNNISWGITNVDADILDWYQIKFRDNKKEEYWYNNQWNKTNRRVEVINIRGQEPLYDTVIYTHHGPVVYEDKTKQGKGNDFVPVGDALRWIAHDESDELMAMYILNRGKNYTDYRKALTYFNAPASNFVFASKDNDIAITPNGKYPLKYRDQGKFILDGTDPADDWHGWIPFDQNPTVKNPPRGFVSSANQSSTDPTYPYYINWSFASYERGKRINDRLTAMQKATVDSMRILQTDTYSIRAQDVLPTLLKYLDVTRLDHDQLSALSMVKNWDKFYSVGSTGASIFNSWWVQFYGMVWSDEFKDKDLQENYPSMDRTEKLLIQQPGAKWFDNVNTPAKETCADIVTQSFKTAVAGLVKKYGKPGPAWAWGKVKKMEITHLTRQEAFSSGNFESGGAGSTVNALHDGHGPSWRMVVQMGPTVKGYGILPGGESGNPGSFFYDDMLKIWQKGELKELLFLQAPDEMSDRVKTTLTINSK
ncbi:penicillin acylase family protein [Mucilaginibacter sp. HC2]|uniref:penicillin acylase family protein n=1 Tax=Mucilaginibacter inviolabilis TaxID=2714892 RepID=UPI0014099446|nr:penicillin acylase family protein [Mucilaginibacter inviolabilis]NHA04534.1 penicillin acylase family protein [Mucilaginibacter inviolabilis]